MAIQPINHGIYGAALTPLHSDLSCNTEELAKHCLDLVKRGCNGVALFGTTGEGPSFSVDEKVHALKSLVQSGFDPKKIILANGSASIPDTVALAREAIKLGCDTLLISPPSFFKNVPEEGVIAYYRAIIEKIAHPGLKAILYHIPQYSGVPITLNIIRALKNEFPHQVVALKESEGNLPFTKEILKAFPGFQVFVGNEKQIIEAVRHGASGSICGIANLYPELIVSLLHREKNPPELEALFAAVKKYPFIPAAKAIMEARRGAQWARVRPPLAALDKDKIQVS